MSLGTVMRLFILFFALFSELTYAADAVIHLGVHNFPPYFVMTSQENCGGSAVEQTRALLQTDDIKVKVICATPARIYKMLESGEVDLTINIKQTKALPKNISFIPTPYAQLSLVLLSHGAAVAREETPSIASIRGFDYHGQREILTDKGYSFIDLPDSISAVELFIKGRSSALITYEAPFNYYLQQQQLPFASQYQRQLLEHIDGFYVIANASKHKAYIQQRLQHHAETEQLSYFSK